jgi:hypothetical protein
MATFGLGVIVGVCLWPLLYAAQWLRRRWFPTFTERVDRRFRPYKPHLPLTLADVTWPVVTVEGRYLTRAEVEEALHIPRTPGSLWAGSPTTESPTTVSSSDVPVMGIISHLTELSSPSDQTTTAAGPAEQPYTFVEPPVASRA